VHVDLFQAVVEGGKSFSSTCWNVDVVVKQIVQTLQAKDAPGQILVGLDAEYFIPILRMLPGWFLALTCKDEKFIPDVTKIDKHKLLRLTKLSCHSKNMHCLSLKCLRTS
jgi:hypothetical protein